MNRRAQVRVEGTDPKSEPPLQLLSVLRTVELICHLWQQYVNTALIALASTSVTIRREMVVFNNQTLSRLEGQVNAVLHKIMDGEILKSVILMTLLLSILSLVTISALTLQLTKQKRNDFKPRNDDLSFARVNTEPCVACCELLEKVRDSASSNLTGKNREVFLTEIGVSFHAYVLSGSRCPITDITRYSLLLEHLQKFPVSATGGLMLAKLVSIMKLWRETNNLHTEISRCIRIQSSALVFQHSTNDSNLCDS